MFNNKAIFTHITWRDYQMTSLCIRSIISFEIRQFSGPIGSIFQKDFVAMGVAMDENYTLYKRYDYNSDIKSKK